MCLFAIFTDVLDLAITKGISHLHSTINSNYDLESDHSPLIITLSADIIWREPPPRLCNNRTNWEIFQRIINENITLNFRMTESTDIEAAVSYLTTLLQNVAWEATPPQTHTLPNNTNLPLHIKDIVQEKRRARRRWLQTRNIQDKTQLNRFTHRLHRAVVESRNSTFSHYITSLSTDDHSLWKATKKLKRPVLAVSPLRTPSNDWARSDEEKVDLFPDHLAQVFTPLPPNNR